MFERLKKMELVIDFDGIVLCVITFFIGLVMGILVIT